MESKTALDIINVESLKGEHIKQLFYSEIFGNKIGLELHHKWNLLTDEQKYGDALFNIFMKSKNRDFESIKKINILYDNLILRNPILKNIKAEIAISKYHILMGCMSKFNYDDIKFFVEHENPVSYNINNEEIYQMIKSKARIHLGWVPSPKTLEMIKNKLNII